MVTGASSTMTAQSASEEVGTRVLDGEANAGNNYEDNVATSFGGKVNEVAWTDTKDFMVGIGSDYRPWYQWTLGTSHGTWAAL